MKNRIKQAMAQCDEILGNSKDCSAEIDLFLGALSRQPEWTDQDIVELQRHLVLHFADQLCSQKS